MKKRAKRFLSWMLVFVMVLGLMPATVFAAPRLKTQETLTVNGKDTVSIAQSGDEATYTFTASDSNAYIMYCQFEKDKEFVFPTVISSPSNALIDPAYINPHPTKRLIGYMVNGNPGESYIMTVESNDVKAYNATVGVKKPLAKANFNGFSGYYYKPSDMSLYYCSLDEDREIKVSLDENTLELIFYPNSLFAYDPAMDWTASSSNASVVSYSGAKSIAEFGNAEYGIPHGFAPVFDLNNEGTAIITIAVTYKGKTVTEDYTVHVGKSPVGGNDPNPTTVNFDDIQDILNEIDNNNTNPRTLVYSGSNAFTFAYNSTDSDLNTITIPDYLLLQFNGQDVIVDNGVTLLTYGAIMSEDLTVNGSVETWNKIEVADTLTVNGTMTSNGDVEAKNLVVGTKGNLTFYNMPKFSNSVDIAGEVTIWSGMWAGNSLNVSGKLDIPEYNVTMRYPASIHVTGTIDGKNQTKISIEHDVKSNSEFIQVLKAAAQHVDKGIEYSLYIIDESNSVYEIAEDLIIPENVTFQMDNISAIHVKNGYTLTNEGSVELCIPLNVYGNLVNSGIILVENMSSNGQKPQFDGVLTLVDDGTSTGTYSGTGALQIRTDLGVNSLSGVINGIDQSKFDYNTENDHLFWWYRDGNNNTGGDPNPTVVQFSTMQAILDEITKNDPTPRILDYNGNSAFTFAKDSTNNSLNITIPSYLALQFNNNDVTIDDGVTLTTENRIDCKNLTVNGDMQTEHMVEVQEKLTVNGTFTSDPDHELRLKDLVVNGSMTVNGSMNVDHGTFIYGTLTVENGFGAGIKLEIGQNGSTGSNGKLIVKDGNVHVRYPGTVNGLENIEFRQDWGQLQFEADFGTMAQLQTQVAALTADTTYANNDRVAYILSMQGDRSQSASDFVIEDDITIPAHVEFQLQGNRKYILAENKKLTVNGRLFVAAPFIVNGTIVNNNDVQVRNNPMRPDEWLNGTITIGANGSYTSSSGAILKVIVNPSVQDVSAVLPWNNLADYTVRESHDPDGEKVWTLVHTAGLTKLGTPTNLTWGDFYRETWWEWDSAGNLIGVHLEKLARPGSMSWKTVRPDQAWVELKLYRVGTSAPIATWRESNDPMVQPEYRSSTWFMNSDFGSGDYYFTVQSIADGTKYRDSDVATSGVYHYSKPNAKLDGCTNLIWEDRNDGFVNWSNWDVITNSSYIDGYQVNYYYSANPNGPYEQFNGIWGRGQLLTEQPLGDYVVQENGTGYYKYEVKALSSDIEKIGNSSWSALSPALDLVTIPEDVEDDLSALLNNANSQNQAANKVREEVQKLDTEDLKKTLLTDQDNSGATQVLSDLEAKAGGPAQVNVDPSVSSFNASDISVVGANLNNKSAQASVNDPITLIVDAPRIDHTIPERFNSAVSVRFSMTLGNVDDPTDLKVPVKISLPVPANINPDYLVVIHYHLDGEPELIWPYIYEKNGKMYADFVVTGFSDFVMTECFEEQIGTDDGINDGDSDDNGSVMPPVSSSDDDRDDSVVSVPVKKQEEALPEYVVSGQWTSVDGKWMFADHTGEPFKNRWGAVVNPYANKEAGQQGYDWFFFDANGHMMTGWILDGGRWYYLNPLSDGTQGRMFTGWQLVDGKWYYLNPVSDGTRGAMAADTWIDGYYVNADGAWEPDKTK